MSELEKFVLEYEANEEAEDMKWSVYYIPFYYQPDQIEELPKNEANPG